VALSRQALKFQPDGYYKIYTHKTYEWALWGQWDCLSVGIRCTVNNLEGPRVGQTMTGAEAQASMLENGRPKVESTIRHVRRMAGAQTRPLAPNHGPVSTHGPQIIPGDSANSTSEEEGGCKSDPNDPDTGL
jgi:hypothetical protein